MFIHTKRKENTVQIRVSNRGDKRRAWLISCKLQKNRSCFIRQFLEKKEKGSVWSAGNVEDERREMLKEAVSA
jgi:hypothetical protein